MLSIYTLAIGGLFFVFVHWHFEKYKAWVTTGPPSSFHHHPSSPLVAPTTTINK